MHINQITKGSKGLPLRLAIICKYITDRTKRVNETIIENMKNYIGQLKRKVGNSNSFDKHSCIKCNCGKKFYYTQLFGVEVPCIHDICSIHFDESILYETVKSNCLNFSDMVLDFSELEVYEIITDLKLKKKNITRSWK